MKKSSMETTWLEKKFPVVVTATNQAGRLHIILERP